MLKLGKILCIEWELRMQYKGFPTIVMEFLAGFQARRSLIQVKKVMSDVGCMICNKLCLDIINKIRELKFLSCSKNGSNSFLFIFSHETLPV